MKQFKELWEYREMISSLVRQDLRGRYKGSVLGFLWTFLNPLLQLMVYTLVFSVIMNNGIERYYLHLFVCLVPWLFFSGSLTGGSACIMTHKDMVTKIYFPRAVMPISYVTSGFVNMLLSFVVVFAVIIVSGVGVNPAALLCLPVVMAVEYIMALGGAMVVSALTVYFRDMEYILGILTMAWMYLTPVLYPLSWVPEKLQPVMNLNPMTSVITAYRQILYYKQIPALGDLLWALLLGVIVLVIGVAVFEKLQKGFAEEL